MAHLNTRSTGKLPQCEKCRLYEGKRVYWKGTGECDVLFMSDYPRFEDIENDTYTKGATGMLRWIVLQEVAKTPPTSIWRKLKVHAGYALQCGFGRNNETIKPSTSDAALCDFRVSEIDNRTPKVIVAMGKLAIQSLGIKVDNFNKIRGKIQEIDINGKSVKVYPTFHPAAVYAAGGGLMKLFCMDLRNALDLAARGTMAHVEEMQDSIKDYVFPNTWQEIQKVVDEVTSYWEDKRHVLAVDSETNTLRMHLDETSGTEAFPGNYAKCIAFSVAWDSGKAAAWLMNHKEVTENPEAGKIEWMRRLAPTFNLLMHGNSLVAHNFQFDLRVVRHLVRMLVFYTSNGTPESVEYRQWFSEHCKYSIDEIVECFGITGEIHDTMIREHALEEDKKGHYGLKPLTGKYKPVFVGYEEALKSAQEGHVVKLSSVKDFVEYIESTEEIVEMRYHGNKFVNWLKSMREAFVDDENIEETRVPEHFRAVAENPDMTVDDVWTVAKKDFTRYNKETKFYLEKLGKHIKTVETPDGVTKVVYEGKALWDLFKRDPEFRSYVIATSDSDKAKYAYSSAAWYIWFQKSKGKDPIKDIVREKAKAMKTEMEMEREEVNFENYPTDELLTYAAIDVDVCREAFVSQSVLFSAEEKEKPSILYKGLPDGEAPSSRAALTKVSMPVCVALSKMSDNGITVDYNYLERLDKKYIEQAAEAERAVFQEANIPDRMLDSVEINLNSTAHVEKLFIAQGLSQYLTERTPTGKVRITKGVLKSISKELGTEKDQMDICKHLLLYRESQKASNTFLKNFREMSAWDGRIHPSFHQTGTATYRLSSSGPNMQNIPMYLARHNLKRCLIPSKPGWAIVNVDASGAEIKMLTAYLAQLSGEHRGQYLISEMNADPKFDMHSRYCAYVFADQMDLDVSTPESWDKAYRWVREHKDEKPIELLRKKIKAVVFGTLYGQTAHGLSNLLGITVEEAEYIIEQFFAADPSIKAYVEWSQKLVETCGYVTTPTGRRRRFPLAFFDQRSLSRAKRQGTNFLIQSLTVDVFNFLLAQFIPVLEKEIGGIPLLQVHDALVMEMPIPALEHAKQLIQKHFEEKASLCFPFLPVRFQCSMEVGDSYGTTMSYEKYIAGLQTGETGKYASLEGTGLENVQLTDPLEELEDENDGADWRLRVSEEDPDDAYRADDYLFDVDMSDWKTEEM